MQKLRFLLIVVFVSISKSIFGQVPQIRNMQGIMCQELRIGNLMQNRYAPEPTLPRETTISTSDYVNWNSSIQSEVSVNNSTQLAGRLNVSMVSLENTSTVQVGISDSRKSERGRSWQQNYTIPIPPNRQVTLDLYGFYEVYRFEIFNRFTNRWEAGQYKKLIRTTVKEVWR